MAHTIRVIPCLDIDKGRVVKGTKFLNLIDAGDPVAIAQLYNDEGADEITFLDISASHEGRDLMVDVLKRVAEKVFIPLTVGGGVRQLSDIQKMLDHGADKVSINTAAISNPNLVYEAARIFGAQCIVVAIDAKQVKEDQWGVFSHGGRHETGLEAVEWAKKMCDYGAGEILLTSMDKDGTKKGFDLLLTASVSEAVDVPVIASGGVGNPQHLVDGIVKGKAQAVLAASIFHFSEYTLPETKAFLQQHNISVRL